MYFDELDLNDNVLDALYDMRFDTCTPVQEKCIPEILEGHDVLGVAQTGTGKTAAYLLPVLSKLDDGGYPKDAINCVIMSPTRELAQQIDQAMQGFGYYLQGVSSVAVYGGNDGNRYDQELRSLRMGADVVIATPGRLISHISLGNVDLSKVSFFILDEADRMLDMGFIHDIRRLLKLIPEKRQTLLFSATFSDEIRELADSFLKDPVNIEIARNKEAAIIEQEAYTIAKKRKRELLRDLIVDNQWEQVLVFTRMKHTANRLAQQLEKDGIVAAAIHGNKSQSARTKALAGFKDHTVRVLVATDIAARGLDIEGLPHVVNYELPNVAEDYVHRIGRTGRAGHPGHAVSLVSPDEKDYLRGIERLLKKKIATQAAAGYEGDVPEDIARDNAEQDKKRAEELRKMREARRAARQKQENARTAPRKNEAKVETTDNAAERFTKKVVRRPAAATLSDNAPRRTPRSSGDRPQTSERRFDRRREDERNERREDRRFADRRSEERRPRRACGEDAAEGNRFRRRDDNRTEQARGARRFEERRRRPDIVSTLVHDDDRRYRRQELKRDDSRFESVSSNLPPGMVLKFRRR